MLSSLAPARRRVVLAALAALALVIAAVTTVLVVRAAGSDDEPSTPVAQDAPGPVVLIPGFGGNVDDLAPLASALRREGKTVVLFHLPGDGTGALTAMAGSLAKTVARLHDDGAPSVDVVGYSAGGVVARLWVRDLGGAAIARRVVTISAPHHGTDLAGAAGSLLPSQCPPACRDLQPGSDLLDRLNAGDETPSGPAFVSIWTSHDTVVLPPASARLQGALNETVQSVCARDRVDHTGMPADPAVLAMVAAALRASPPERVGNCPL